jgi:hypothetical protein
LKPPFRLIAAILAIACAGFWLSRDPTRRAGEESNESGSSGPMSQGPPPTTGAPSMSHRQMLKRATQIPDVTPEEQAAIDRAVEQKFVAVGRLRGKSVELLKTAMNPEASDSQVLRAIEDYGLVRATYERSVVSIDAALGDAVSVRTRARLLSGGFLENGLGFLSSRPPTPVRPPSGPGMPAGPDANASPFQDPRMRTTPAVGPGERKPQ